MVVISQASEPATQLVLNLFAGPESVLPISILESAACRAGISCEVLALAVYSLVQSGDLEPLVSTYRGVNRGVFAYWRN